jgi:hypothetical protein
VRSRIHEDRQRKPDDLEAQEGQRAIAVHALENLATSIPASPMLRRALREQIKRVSDGLDPMNMKWMSSLTEKYRAQRVEHDPVVRRGNLCIRERRCLGELKGRRASFLQRSRMTMRPSTGVQGLRPGDRRAK